MSFTGITVKQFDDIYHEINQKAKKHKIKRLSYKENIEEKEALVL